MINDFASRRRTILEKRLAELYEEYEAAYAQLGRMLADTDTIKIKRQIAYLDEAIKEVEQQLKQLTATGGKEGDGHGAADEAASEASASLNLIALVDILNSRFDLSELGTFAFYLSIDLDDLPGEGKRRKAEELVKYLNRHLRLDELLRVGRQRRPDIAWPEKLVGIPSPKRKINE
jgi:hypothetical protein